MLESEYYNRLYWAYPEPLPEGFVKPDHFDPPEPKSTKGKIKSFEITLSNFDSDKAAVSIIKNADSNYTISIEGK